MHDNPHSSEPHQTPRRWLAIACMLLAFMAGFLISVPAESSRQQSVSIEILPDPLKAEPMPARPSSLLAPDDTRSPKQVVEMQMEALFAYRHNRAAIHQVFAHASPANRAVAGPLENFEQMILHPQYNSLVVSEHCMVGQAVERGKVAAVLVTVVDGQGRLSVFRFCLSMQSDTYPGCWMTDGVFRLVGNWRPGETLPGVEQKLLDNI